MTLLNFRAGTSSRTDPVIRSRRGIYAWPLSRADDEHQIVNALSHYTDWTIIMSRCAGMSRLSQSSASPGRMEFSDSTGKALHHLDVGIGHPPGADVAGL
jgi:hypothetical protein